MRLNCTTKPKWFLTPVKFVEVRNGNSYWEFKCICGKLTVKKASPVMRGRTKSCGCFYSSSVVGHEYKDGYLYSIKGNGKKQKCLAKSNCNGVTYLSFRDKGKTNFVHRKIWEIHYGKIKKGMVIDHINGCSTDNRIENLQCVTQSDNLLKQKIRVDNTSGITGVYQVGPRWCVDTSIKGKRYRKCGFETKDLAIQFKEKVREQYM